MQDWDHGCLLMSNIPLTRAQFVLPFTHILDTLGASTDALLEKHKLPVNLWASLDNYVPIRNAVQFAEAAGRSEGIEDFGFLVTRDASFHYLSKRLRTLVLAAPTLYAALKVLCVHAHLEDTNLHMSLAFHGDSVRLQSRVSGLKGMPHLEHSQWLQNVIPIHVVREFAGPDWAPATMGFEARYTPGNAPREYWRGTRFLGAQSCSWIDIPVAYLGLPPICRAAHHGADESADARISGKLVDAIKLMLPSYLGGNMPTLRDIADMANTSPRNLQRMLASAGVTYREILNAVRFERAASLLRKHDIKILDIALFLGYTDAAHFTRAFRSMAGVSPTHFRRLHN